MRRTVHPSPSEPSRGARPAGEDPPPPAEKGRRGRARRRSAAGVPALCILLAGLFLAAGARAGKKEEALAKIQAFLDEGDLENAKGLIDFLLRKNPGDADLLRLLDEWRIRKSGIGPLLEAGDLEKPENREKLRAILFRVVEATARGNPEEWEALLHAGDDARARRILARLAGGGAPEDRRVARDLLARIGKPPPAPAPPRPVADLLCAAREGPESCLAALREAERRRLRALAPVARKVLASKASPELRFAAAGLLLALGESGPRRTLRAALSSPRAVEAVAAFEVLLRHPGKGERPLQALLEAVEKDETIGRAKPTLLALGFRAVAEAREPGARALLTSHLAEPDLRVDAARALGVLGDPGAVPALLDYLRRPPPAEEDATGGGLSFLGRTQGLKDAAAAEEVRPLLVGALALLRVTAPPAGAGK